MASKFLSRERILGAVALPQQVVDVPEWGGSVLVQGMTGAQRDDFEQSIVRMHGKKTDVDMRNIRAKLAAQCIVDESGERLFTDEDVQALGKLSAGALDRVFEAAQRLSGISSNDMEELEKNLTSSQGGDSISD